MIRVGYNHRITLEPYNKIYVTRAELRLLRTQQQRAATWRRWASLSDKKPPRNTFDLEKAYGPLAAAQELNLNRLTQASYVTEDSLTIYPKLLLQAALNDFLPPRSAKSIDQSGLLHLGLQQAYFRPFLEQRQLLADGTDDRFLPGDASLWRFRLWAGGSVKYRSLDPHRLCPVTDAVQHECVDDIRIIGNHQPERIFVTIRKDIGVLDESRRSEQLNSLTSFEPHQFNPFLEEIYNICFLRDPPGRPGSERKPLKPPSDPTFSHQMVPTQGLLTQFSAITYNAHSIHIDRMSAIQDYKLKAPVVHGPLTMVLMLEFLHTCLSKLEGVPENMALVCMSIDYKNYSPLYVDELLELCCKPWKLERNQQAWQAEAWQVWIQHELGNTKTVAFRGVVTVKAIEIVSQANVE